MTLVSALKNASYDPGDMKWIAYAPSALTGIVEPEQGWLLCNGQSLTTSAPYDKLFAAIGYKYGGSGANFNLPDYRDRLALPTGDNAARPAGAFAGALDHTHTVPSHQHSMGSHYHGMWGHQHSLQAHVHGGSTFGASGTANAQSGGDASAGTTTHTHGIGTGGSSGNTGGPSNDATGAPSSITGATAPATSVGNPPVQVCGGMLIRY